MTELNLENIRKYLLKNLGLNFSIKQEKDLYQKLTVAASAFNFHSTVNFINWLLEQSLNEEQTKKLATFLTIGETYFFREQKALDFLESSYLPELIKKRKGNNRRLKIWSAGCSSGEEPYSIAILLQRLLPNIGEWDITIRATDINTILLEKAEKGIYSKWSFRGTPEIFRRKYFKEIDKNKYQILQSVREQVTFSFLNLAVESYPPPFGNPEEFDVILCRNVLIYFSVEGITEVALKFYNTLKDQGVLLVSPVEASYLLASPFTHYSAHGATIFRKDSRGRFQPPKNSANAPISIKSNHKILQKPAGTTVSPVIKSKRKEQLGKREKKVTPFEIYRKIEMESAPVNPGVSDYARALEYYNAGKLDEAENLIEKNSRSSAGNSPRNLLLKAKIEASRGRLSEAEKICLKVIEQDKVNVEAHCFLSTIFTEQGKTEQAIKSLNNTLFLKPDFVLGYFFLGNIYLKQKKKSESRKYFANALKILAKFNPDEILPYSDGLTAKSLKLILKSVV